MAEKKARSGRTRIGGARARASAPKRAAPRSIATKVAARSAAQPSASPKPAVAEKPASPAEVVPSGIGAWHQHLDYTSHDMKAIKRFYGETLGFTRMIEEPEVGYLSIRTTPTTTLGFMAPVPGHPPEQWRPPGEPALYFFVRDVDRAHRHLVAKGVSFEQPPTDMPWGHRMAICRDPEGRMVCLAQREGPGGGSAE